MSKLRCCFCQQELKYDAWNEVYMCRNPNCKHLLGFGTKELWQALTDSMKEHDLCHDALVERTKELDRTRKALDYCIKRFKSLENVLDEKAEASDIPDNPDLYAWAVRIKTIWSELKEITGIDYTKGGDNE